jgi:hypothetical protein
VSTALTGAMHKALSFVHEIKTVITIETISMTDDKATALETGWHLAS